MRSTRIRRALFALPVILATAFFAGCTDMPTADETAFAFRADVELRNFHLLDRAKSTPVGKTAADEEISLLIGFSDSNVSAMKIVRRWKIVKRWKIVRRWESAPRIPDLAITIPAADLETFMVAVQGEPEVAWVEPDVRVWISTPGGEPVASTGQHVPWGIAPTGADRSWAASGDGSKTNGEVDVDIYLLDTGASNPDLNVVECLELTARGLGPCHRLDDVNGHGTEVIGAAAAMDNDRGIVGVAPGARIHVVKILNEMGEAESSDIIRAIGYITERKLQNPTTPMVVNMSFGVDAETTSYISMDEAVRASAQTGIVYVVAAGNDGRDASTYSPSHVAEAITVGAYNERDQISTFSNWGPAVDLLAPGEMIEALTADDQLTLTSGTSVAAGWVSGAAGLYLARHPGASPDEVRQALVLSARPGLISRRSTTDVSVYVGN